MTTMTNNIDLYENYDVAVIGGGPGGLSAAISARENGAEKVILIERGSNLGGVLNQCIHSGFGLHEFKEELTGPEYAQRFIDKIEETDILILTNTMVIDLTEDKKLTLINESTINHITAKAVVLTMGCRERTAGAIGLNGYRPAGVLTAGTAQKLANEEGLMVGKSVVIYGSGDIGLIMARRMILEGADVKTVVEIMPESSGLKRNIAQCLEDFDVPLKLSTAIKEIHGTHRVVGVTLVKVDENRRWIKGTEEYIPCDTVLLSVGLIPENELSINAGVDLNKVTSGPLVDDNLMTSKEGIFAAGNVLHVHDIVDFVSKEAYKAGKNAALYSKALLIEEKTVDIVALNGIRYVVPQKLTIREHKDLGLFLRVLKTSKFPTIKITMGNKELFKRKYPIVIPSEMININLNLKDVEITDDIKVSLLEDKND